MVLKTKGDKGTSVDEVIAGLPRGEQVIVKRLRALILECLPKATEKVTYGVPFYHRHRMIVFVWPPSINPRKQKKPNEAAETRVGLSFCQGNRMSNEDGALLKEGRKQVYCMYFNTIDEINDVQIRALLFEAGMVDDAFGSKKRNGDNYF